MKLTIKERIALQGILQSQTGGMSKMILIREIINKTGITSDEVEKTGMIDTPKGDTIWDATKDPNKEFAFNESELGIINESAKDADQNGRVTLDSLSLIERLLK